jgi:ATP-binding cassette, subfamily B, bacterial
VSETANLSRSVPGVARLLRRFWPYTRTQTPLLVGALAALFAEIALRALEPWPLKFVFDRILMPGRRTRHIPHFLETLDPVSLLTVAALAVVVIVALRALAAYLNTVGFALIGNRVLTEVRNDLYRHVQALSLSFHAKARSGDLIIRVIGDIGMLKDVAVTALLPLLANVLVFAAMIAMMIWLNWQLGLLALATFPLFLLATRRLTYRIREASRRQRKREGAMAATAAESIGAIRLVQSLSLEGQFSEAFAGQNRKSLREGVQGSRLAASLERTVDVLIAVSTALVLWAGARLAMKGAITPGDLIVLLAYLKNAFKPMQDFAKYSGRLAKATAAGERVLDLLGRTPEVRDRPDAVPAPTFKGDVRFDRVSFSYEPGRPALDAVDFEVRAGECVALVGPSGSGKSTLVSLILRLYDPTAGRVLVDGRDVREYRLESVRRQIAIVPQDTLLFAATIRENIGCAAPGVAAEAIEEAASLARATEFIEALPEGYETVVGERGVTLSAGQRQRIAIARAAIRRCPLLILDEPLTGLDEENRRAVGEALANLASGRTTFHITHDVTHGPRADLVFELEHGRLNVEGPRRAPLGDPPLRIRGEPALADLSRAEDADAFAR